MVKVKIYNKNQDDIKKNKKDMVKKTSIQYKQYDLEKLRH